MFAQGRQYCKIQKVSPVFIFVQNAFNLIIYKSGSILYERNTASVKDIAYDKKPVILVNFDSFQQVNQAEQFFVTRQNIVNVAQQHALTLHGHTV